MDIGAAFFNTDFAIPIDELARELEARGFESLFVAEHSHIPASRKSPWSGGAQLPKQYWHTLDPFVGLTWAAAHTRRLKLGTGICLVIERDTIATAKSVASLDFVSGGRFLFGVGGGWNLEEMQNHGTDPRTRFKRLEEQLRAMKEIWTRDAAEFHGRFIDFDPLWCDPKPVQKPHPPVLIAGESMHTIQRVVDVGDGWFPRGRVGTATLLAGMKELAARAARAGRDMTTISVSVFNAPAERADLDTLAAAGVTRALLSVPSEPRDRVLPLLDQYARFMR